MPPLKVKPSDPRECPAYTVSEVAQYLRLPPATVRYWSVGRDGHAPLIDVPPRKPLLLSFLNLTELHVLAAIRRKHQVKMRSIRSAIQYLARHAQGTMDKRHPLISRELETDGLDLFTEHYGKLVTISKSGQTAMRQIIAGALRRIHRDPSGVPVRLYPFTRNAVDETPATIVIDPTISAGRPVIAGTGLATQLIAERYNAGESIKDLANDYERGTEEIEEAIRCELRAAA